MEQKATDKLLGTYSHLLTLITVSAVSVPECDQTILDLHDAVVGDGNMVGISAK